MTISELGSLGELISSVAVLVTLVYLAVQLRQANNLAIARTREHMATLTISELMKFGDSSEDWKSLLFGDDLTDEQKVRLNFQLLAMMRRQEFDWWQYRNKLLDEEAFRASQIHLYDTFMVPRMRLWWKELAREGHFDPSFVAEIDRIISEVEDTPDEPYLKAFEKWAS